MISSGCDGLLRDIKLGTTFASSSGPSYTLEVEDAAISRALVLVVLEVLPDVDLSSLP